MRPLPGVGDVRGLGLMAGIEFIATDATGNTAPDAAAALAVQQATTAQGLLSLTCGPAANVVRLIPALVVTAEEIDLGVARFLVPPSPRHSVRPTARSHMPRVDIAAELAELGVDADSSTRRLAEYLVDASTTGSHRSPSPFPAPPQRSRRWSNGVMTAGSRWSPRRRDLDGRQRDRTPES